MIQGHSKSHCRNMFFGRQLLLQNIHYETDYAQPAKSHSLSNSLLFGELCIDISEVAFLTEYVMKIFHDLIHLEGWSGSTPLKYMNY